jgi:hypothetical protein
VAGDRFILAQPNTKVTPGLGAAVFSSLFLVDATLQNTDFGKTEYRSVEQAGLEVAGGVAATYALDKFIFNDGVYRYDTVQKVGLITAADTASTYLRDTTYNRI